MIKNQMETESLVNADREMQVVKVGEKGNDGNTKPFTEAPDARKVTRSRSFDHYV